MSSQTRIENPDSAYVIMMHFKRGRAIRFDFRKYKAKSNPLSTVLRKREKKVIQEFLQIPFLVPQNYLSQG